MPRPLLSRDSDAAVREFDADRAGVAGVPSGAVLVGETFGRGAPVYVLLHGLGMGRSVFVDLVEHLADTPLGDAEGLEGTVVAVDLPGFGEAPEPERPLTMAEHAELVAAFLGSESRRDTIVVGHSMGSQIAVELAARHPDLVAAVVLAAPTVDQSARGVLKQALRLGRDILRLDPRVFLRGAREYLRAGPHLAAKVRATVTHRPEKALSRIRVPTLVLRGASDPVCPAPWCQSVVDGLSDARFEVIPGHGHETLISDSRPAVELIVDFLRQTFPPAKTG
ncbi:MULTISPECIES: alpha/beta fold hydrolase [Microbacterium]|uniref:alpha/beta fold hydrolase n=1 Tax=Microbacterium TaxID=33882 RepID=UPI00300F9624